MAAIENVDDANHKTAMQYREKIRIGDTPFRALYTSNYVIDETLTLLRIHCGHTVAVESRKSLEASKLVRTLWVTEALEAAAWKIFEKHADKDFSFTDCTSFALMQAEAIRNAFTFDQHFSQYGFAAVPGRNADATPDPFSSISIRVETYFKAVTTASFVRVLMTKKERAKPVRLSWNRVDAETPPIGWDTSICSRDRRRSTSSLFLSANKKLLRVADAEGLDALNVETDKEQITSRFYGIVSCWLILGPARTIGDSGCKLSIASKGRAVKQWQKLIQLGLECLFYAVTTSEETVLETLTTETSCKTLEKLGGVKPEKAVFVGWDLAREIAVAKAAKMITVRMRTVTNGTSVPMVADQKEAFEIGKPSDVLGILGSPVRGR